MSGPYKARESVFSSRPDHYLGDTQATCPSQLFDCVQAMEDCCAEMQAVQEILYIGTHDLPRMQKVLELKRHYLLVGDSTVQQYKADLADEIEPEVNKLIERANAGSVALRRKETALQAKADTARARASRPNGLSSKMDVRKASMLTKQRERMEEELSTLSDDLRRLELQVLS